MFKSVFLSMIQTVNAGSRGTRGQDRTQRSLVAMICFNAVGEMFQGSFEPDRAPSHIRGNEMLAEQPTSRLYRTPT